VRDEESHILTLQLVGLPSNHPILVGAVNILGHILVQSKLYGDAVREVLLNAIHPYELTGAQEMCERCQFIIPG
jgi:hypothetical protein